MVEIRGDDRARSGVVHHRDRAAVVGGPSLRRYGKSVKLRGFHTRVGVGPVRGCVVFAVAAPALHGATTADTLQLWLDPEPAPAFADAESWVGGDGPADTRGSAGRESLTWYHVAGDGLVASTVDRVITPGPGGSPPWWQDPDPRAINADIMGATLNITNITTNNNIVYDGGPTS